MAAPLGNSFWRARSTHGREKLFSTPDCLWSACCEYFQWVEENPLIEMRPFAYQGVVVQEPVPKMRAMTINGLCIFLDIDLSTWNTYKNREGYEDYFTVIKQAEQIIYEQKFTGAAADLLNANIISRELGLADKQEIKQTADVKVSADMSPQDAARAYQDLMGA